MERRKTRERKEYQKKYMKIYLSTIDQYILVSIVIFTLYM